MKSFLPVLAYQKIGQAPKNSHLKKEWTSTKKLESMLLFLINHGYTFITPADLAKKLPTKPILLAFFGGYQSFYSEVFPLLKKHNAKATVFVATNTLGSYNSWQDPYQEPWQNVLTVPQLKEMYKSKRMAVGTLGLSGENLLNYDKSSRAHKELLESIHRLKVLHKIDACAVGFWPGIQDKNTRIPEITHTIALPIITPHTGRNPQGTTQFLRILTPGIFTRWILAK
ncbi:MAG: polysaccharide deacetylase family protein [Elusimicrobiaceae bacterium]|nr:polysaccharide deacetylase family protein [Elusimicrobiaceae bacterium]